MLTSSAVQIMLLFGVIIASGLLLTLFNDLISAARHPRPSTRTSRVYQPRPRHQQVIYSRVAYGRVTPIRVAATPARTFAKLSSEPEDFKVITVRMRGETSGKGELSKAA